MAEEIAQLVKAPTTKTDDLSLVSEPTQWEEKMTPASHPMISTVNQGTQTPTRDKSSEGAVYLYSLY